MNKEIKKSIEKLVEALNEEELAKKLSLEEEKALQFKVTTAKMGNGSPSSSGDWESKGTGKKVPPKKKTTDKSKLTKLEQDPFNAERKILGMKLANSIVARAIFQIHSDNSNIPLETITKSVCDYVLKKARKKFGKKFYNKGGGSKKRIAMPKLSVKQFVKIRPQKPDKPTKAKATKAKK